MEQTRPMMDIGTGVPADHDDSTTPSAVAPCFSEPDPAAAPCTSKVPPTWFDPMLEELDASQVMCHTVGAPAPGCLLFQEVRASLMDTSSPVTTTQCRTDLPLSSPVQCTPPWTGPPVVTGDAAPGEAGPTVGVTFADPTNRSPTTGTVLW
jgi:hypothetical protein